MRAWPVITLCLAVTACPDDVEEGEARADGARRLTAPSLLGMESNQNACISRDGTFIVFTRFDRGYNVGPAHIWRLDLREDASPVQLTDGDYDDVNVPFGCFDRISGRVIFASDREDANDLWSINPDPANPDLRRLTSHGATPLWIEPVYSPDGQSVALQSGDDISSEEGQRGSIVLVRLDTSVRTVLTNADGLADDRLPSWSPDGEWVLYQHREPSEADSLERWAARMIRVDGGSTTDISALAVRDNPGPDTDLSWMPNGRFVLSSANHGGLRQPSVFALPVAGGPVVRVTSDAEHEDGAPCATPDGLRIAFESHRGSDADSPSDLWIIDAPAEIR